MPRSNVRTTRTRAGAVADGPCEGPADSGAAEGGAVTAPGETTVARGPVSCATRGGANAGTDDVGSDPSLARLPDDRAPVRGSDRGAIVSTGIWAAIAGAATEPAWGAATGPASGATTEAAYGADVDCAGDATTDRADGAATQGPGCAATEAAWSSADDAADAATDCAGDAIGAGASDTITRGCGADA
jgi:hypothetical protein